MSHEELTRAWDEALDAPMDTGRWRLLADALLSGGHAQGELMQLELEAEDGEVTGPARDRLDQLRQELPSTLLPAGVPAGAARFHRGALVEARADLPTLQREGADEPRWQSVQVLALGDDPRKRPEGAAPAPSAPLTGCWLRHLRAVEHVRLEHLEQLAQGPVRARLAEVSAWDHGWNHTPPARWRERWEQLAARAPRLAHVRLDGVAGPHRLGLTRCTRDWLEPLLGLPLARVTVGVTFDALSEVWAWARQHAPRWRLVVQPRSGGLFIELGADGLEPFTDDPQRYALELERIKHRGGYGVELDTEVLVRRHWPREAGKPPDIRLRGLGERR